MIAKIVVRTFFLKIILRGCGRRLGVSGLGCKWVFIEVSLGCVPRWEACGCGLGSVRVPGLCVCSLMHAEVRAVMWVWVCGVCQESSKKENYQ